jgi:hypothetical protein
MKNVSDKVSAEYAENGTDSGADKRFERGASYAQLKNDDADRDHQTCTCRNPGVIGYRF